MPAILFQTFSRFKGERASWWIAIGIVGLVFIGQARLIDGSHPYPQHFDERYVLRPAKRILQTGDLNPHFFGYPSLPIYATAIAMSAGFVWENSKPGPFQKIKNIGDVTPPYYAMPRVCLVPRLMFCFFGCLALLWAGMLGKHLYGHASLALVPIVLATVPEFLHRSWSYVNVDILLASLVLLTFMSLSTTVHRSCYWFRCVLPGILVGACIATKYTGALMFLPAALAIWLFDRKQRIQKTLVLGLCSMGFFVAFVPFSVLDLPAFLNDMSFENWHYKVRGHNRHNVEPGVPNLIEYGKDLLNIYGILGTVFAVVGLVASFRRNWRLTLIVFVTTLTMVFFLSGYRVHFTRNILSVMAVFAVFVGIGVAASFELISKFLKQIPHPFDARWMNLISGLIVLMICMITLPWHDVALAYRRPPDSRNLFGPWAMTSQPNDTQLVIPNSLKMDLRSLEGRFRIISVDLASSSDTSRILPELSKGRTVLLIPGYSQRGKWVGRAVRAEREGLLRLGAAKIIKRFGNTPVVPAPKRDLADPLFYVAVMQ
jgi:4-amino-4-deoxy-L-arabinose transferase-like glycosyltransferase